MSPSAALLLTAAVTLLFAFPGLNHARGRDQSDSFPVSRFTMFATPRGEVQQIVYLRGIEADGTRRRVRVKDVWSGGMNAGWKRLNRLARKSKKTRERTCRKTAKRISKRRRLRGIVELEVVAARYSPAEYFGQGIEKPRSERIVVRCPVPERKE